MKAKQEHKEYPVFDAMCRGANWFLLLVAIVAVVNGIVYVINL